MNNTKQTSLNLTDADFAFILDQTVVVELGAARRFENFARRERQMASRVAARFAGERARVEQVRRAARVLGAL